MNTRISVPHVLAVCLAFCVVSAAEGFAESAASLVPKTEAALASGSGPVTVVCFGDSVTGVYYHTGGRRAYADMLEIALRRLYPDATVKVVNAGISGHTTKDGLARMDNDVLSHKPNLVTVMFGLNDMTRVPLEDYKANLKTIIERCRAIGAEVVLCTPNSIYETSNRPIAKLEEYVAAMRSVGEAEQAPVVDCYAAYEAVRAEDYLRWALLMSESIHPGMHGHKLFAELIAKAVSGRAVSLEDVGPLSPAIPKTLALLQANKPVKVYAMAPYDAYIVAALKKVAPDAQLEVQSWDVAGKTIAEIEAQSKTVRDMGVDLVVVAVPAEATGEMPEPYLRSYAWILNYALSFGLQEWDCFAVLPSVTQPVTDEAAVEREKLARELVRGQDIGMVERMPNEEATAQELLTNWILREAGAKQEER